MTKRDILIASGGFMTAAVIVAGAWLIFGHHPAKKPVSAKQTVGDHIIPLNQSSAPDNTGGLSVTSAGAANLGQLGGGNGQSSGGGASSNNGLDPANFKQYDKYKDGQSGLFADVQKGTGNELAAGHKASVAYKGWLTDGTLFDQSRTDSNGQPQPFVFTEGAGQVIPGWEQAMNGMKAGGTRLLIIPPAVGYGSQGQGPIPPNAVLVFLVQLLDVQ